jgi:hypothetical protein
LGFKAEVAEHKLPGTVYWVDLAPRPGMTTVPIADLFAEGVGSRIEVQPCPPPPAASPAAQPLYPIPVPQQAATATMGRANLPQAQAAATPKLP